MPAVLAPATILVTGASGFVGAQVASKYLEAGYKVVATVRSSPKGDYLKEVFKAYGDKFSYLIVEDIGKPGAFDAAVKGVDAIAHTAAPFHFNSTNPDDLWIPARQGTLEILESAAKAPNVKRVIITSSTVTISPPTAKPGYIYSEKDWNVESEKEVLTKGGAEAGPLHIYFASKTRAEKAAWEFMEANKGKVNWDLITLQPPWIFGPSIHEVSNVNNLNTSLAYFRNIALNSASAGKDKEELTSSLGAFADVRDVANAHVLATRSTTASNDRIAIAPDAFSPQSVYDALNAAGIKAPTGFPGEEIRNPLVFDVSKSKRVLGIQYLDPKQSWVDTTQSLLDRFGPVAA